MAFRGNHPNDFLLANTPGSVSVPFTLIFGKFNQSHACEDQWHFSSSTLFLSSNIYFSHLLKSQIQPTTKREIKKKLKQQLYWTIVHTAKRHLAVRLGIMSGIKCPWLLFKQRAFKSCFKPYVPALLLSAAVEFCFLLLSLFFFSIHVASFLIAWHSSSFFFLSVAFLNGKLKFHESPQNDHPKRGHHSGAQQCARKAGWQLLVWRNVYESSSFQAAPTQATNRQAASHAILGAAVADAESAGTLSICPPGYTQAGVSRSRAKDERVCGRTRSTPAEKQFWDVERLPGRRDQSHGGVEWDDLGCRFLLSSGGAAEHHNTVWTNEWNDARVRIICCSIQRCQPRGWWTAAEAVLQRGWTETPEVVWEAHDTQHSHRRRVVYVSGESSSDCLKKKSTFFSAFFFSFFFLSLGYRSKRRHFLSFLLFQRFFFSWSSSFAFLFSLSEKVKGIWKKKEKEKGRVVLLFSFGLRIYTWVAFL